MLCSAALVVPVSGYAYNSMVDADGVTKVVESVKLSVKGRSVRVQQAQGSVLEVYSVTGTKVKSVKIESADQTVTLDLGKGCYIVKVGNVARKISVL